MHISPLRVYRSDRLGSGHIFDSPPVLAAVRRKLWTDPAVQRDESDVKTGRDLLKHF